MRKWKTLQQEGSYPVSSIQHPSSIVVDHRHRHPVSPIGICARMAGGRRLVFGVQETTVNKADAPGIFFDTNILFAV